MSHNVDSDSSSAPDNEDQVSSDGDDQWEDLEPDQERINVIGLFSEEDFPDVNSMLQHCKDQHDFDLVKIKTQLGLEFLDLVKLVNFVRSEVRKGNINISVTSKSIFEDDQYLLPVLEDDALLFSLDEITESDQQSLHDSPRAKGKIEAQDDGSTLRHLSELQDELQCLQTQFRAYREAVDETLERRWNSEKHGTKLSRDGGQLARSPNLLAKDESQYFTSYSYNEIHETMLKDTVRTDAYRDFIYNNKNLFKGKVILDVGCGTGILSMFCAKAGAAKVIAVDNSDIIDKARENVFGNDMGDTITCLRGKIEEVSLPVSRVDIIVSEWMGYCLLYEAMLDSILWARDRYLASGGLIIPSHITLFVAPLADPDYIADHVSFWRSVYGFKMNSMLAHIYDEVLIRDVDSSNLPGPASPFFRLDLYSITADQLEFTNAPFSITLKESVDSFDGFVIWFDTFFLPSNEASQTLEPSAKAEEWAKDRGVAFTTGPGGRRTHWQQGVLLIDHGKSGSQALEKGLSIDGTIGYKKRQDNRRALDIEVRWEAKGTDFSGKQTWSMC